MNRIVLACHGVPVAYGAEAATDIEKEFVEHRQWHTNVRCTWNGAQLILEAENDYDSDGAALVDEFSDCVAAYVPGTFGYQITVESAKQCR